MKKLFPEDQENKSTQGLFNFEFIRDTIWNLGQSFNSAGDSVRNFIQRLNDSYRNIVTQISPQKTSTSTGGVPPSEPPKPPKSTHPEYPEYPMGGKAFGLTRIPIDPSSIEDLRSSMLEGARRTILSTRLKIEEPQLQAAESIARLDLFRTMFSPTGIVSWGALMALMFPLQMSLFGQIRRPLDNFNDTAGKITDFLSGFMPIPDIGTQIMNVFKTSPIARYENIEITRRMLASSLGGEERADRAIQVAISMAKEFPMKFEEILQNFRSLSVYPTVKPLLTNKEFQENLLKAVSGLALINPMQGVGGALFSLVEALSGSQRSMQFRFNINADLIAALAGYRKEEMSADPEKLIMGIKTFVEKTVGEEALTASKYTLEKQIENIDDAITGLVYGIFQRIPTYQAMTKGVLSIQSAIGGIGENQALIEGVESFFEPFTQSLYRAISNFAKLPTGMVQKMPFEALSKYIEEDFKNLSPDEMRKRFTNFIKETAKTFSDFYKSPEFKEVRNAIREIVSPIMTIGAEVIGESMVGMFRGVTEALVQNPMMAANLAVSTLTMGAPVFMGLAVARKIAERAILKKSEQSLKDQNLGSDRELGKNKGIEPGRDEGPQRQPPPPPHPPLPRDQSKSKTREPKEITDQRQKVYFSSPDVGRVIREQYKEELKKIKDQYNKEEQIRMVTFRDKEIDSLKKERDARIQELRTKYANLTDHRYQEVLGYYLSQKGRDDRIVKEILSTKGYEELKTRYPEYTQPLIQKERPQQMIGRINNFIQYFKENQFEKSLMAFGISSFAEPFVTRAIDKALGTNISGTMSGQLATFLGILGLQTAFDLAKGTKVGSVLNIGNLIRAGTLLYGGYNILSGMRQAYLPQRVVLEEDREKLAKARELFKDYYSPNIERYEKLLGRKEEELTEAERIKGLGKTIGGTVGLLLGGAIGFALGSIIPGAGNIKGALIGAGIGSTVGSLIGEYIGGKQSEKRLKELDRILKTEEDILGQQQKVAYLKTEEKKLTGFGREGTVEHKKIREKIRESELESEAYEIGRKARLEEEGDERILHFDFENYKKRIENQANSLKQFSAGLGGLIKGISDNEDIKDLAKDPDILSRAKYIAEQGSALGMSADEIKAARKVLSTARKEGINVDNIKYDRDLIKKGLDLITKEEIPALEKAISRENIIKTLDLAGEGKTYQLLKKGREDIELVKKLSSKRELSEEEKGQLKGAVERLTDLRKELEPTLALEQFRSIATGAEFSTREDFLKNIRDSFAKQRVSLLTLDEETRKVEMKKMPAYLMEAERGLAQVEQRELLAKTPVLRALENYGFSPGTFLDLAPFDKKSAIQKSLTKEFEKAMSAEGISNLAKLQIAQRYAGAVDYETQLKNVDKIYESITGTGDLRKILEENTVQGAEDSLNKLANAAEKAAENLNKLGDRSSNSQDNSIPNNQPNNRQNLGNTNIPNNPPQQGNTNIPNNYFPQSYPTEIQPVNTNNIPKIYGNVPLNQFFPVLSNILNQASSGLQNIIYQNPAHINRNFKSALSGNNIYILINEEIS